MCQETREYDKRTLRIVRDNSPKKLVTNFGENPIKKLPHFHNDESPEIKTSPRRVHKNMFNVSSV